MVDRQRQRQKPALLIGKLPKLSNQYKHFKTFECLDKPPCSNILSGNASLDRFAYRTDCQPQPISSQLNCAAEKKLRFLQMLFSQFKTEMFFVGKMATGGMKSGRVKVIGQKTFKIVAQQKQG